MSFSKKESDFQKVYQKLQEQQNEEKQLFMKQNYEKLPSWSRHEVSSGILGSQHATSGVLEGLCKKVQQHFDEDREKFMKENADKVSSWSK
ncbi:Oligoendopeptidase F [Caenorhabditis elegans]|uniref:Oligoendopeptidase F n=1 Tax=Caenorhabditis elegans TaxID=6239 RepID=Q7YX90_CAEEL|nr:Oligoendopeptidase F [Caenorhabditis elegans]CAE17689.1 Oligoendopeptidase F [Caenorhabditis elegans]|eukprot:NP_001024354.1 Uncharacterized protein CELE_C04A11.5 [Caenorhabditis elegans]